MSDADPRETHPSLLLRLRDAHDEQSWRSFVELYAPLIYRCCRRRGLQDADASDVGQEVLTQVARSIRTFEYRPERGRFRDWLGSVVRSKVARFFEREGRLVRVAGGEGYPADRGPVGDGADPMWEAEFQGHVLRAALGRIRGRFEAHTWRAFEGVWLEGRPALEVAEAVGLPIDAVYLAKSRVLRRLREEVMLLAEDFPLISAPDRQPQVSHP